MHRALYPLLGLALGASASPYPQPQPLDRMTPDGLTIMSPKPGLVDDGFRTTGFSVWKADRSGPDEMHLDYWYDRLGWSQPGTGAFVYGDDTTCKIPLHNFAGGEGSWSALLGAGSGLDMNGTTRTFEMKNVTLNTTWLNTTSPAAFNSSDQTTTTVACRRKEWTITFNTNQNTTQGFNLTLRHAVSLDGQAPIYREVMIPFQNGIANWKRSTDGNPFLLAPEDFPEDQKNVTTYLAPDPNVPHDSYQTILSS